MFDLILHVGLEKCDIHHGTTWMTLTSMGLVLHDRIQFLSFFLVPNVLNLPILQPNAELFTENAKLCRFVHIIVYILDNRSFDPFGQFNYLANNASWKRDFMHHLIWKHNLQVLQQIWFGIVFQDLQVLPDFLFCNVCHVSSSDIQIKCDSISRFGLIINGLSSSFVS